MRNSLTGVIVATLVALLTNHCRAQTAAEEQAFRQAAAIADPSIVRIETVGGLDVVGDLLTGTGPTTGVVVSPDGDVITSSFNFISRPASILVTLADGRRFPAEQIASDRSRMLTLLKIEAAGLVPLEPAAKADFQVGQWAIALGRTYDSPFPGVSVGIVSALDRIYGRAVQTDAKVSPVNYGGPLVDLDGRGIGILVPLSPQGEDETAGVEWYDSGIGFAVPVEDVYRVLERLQTGDDLHPGLVGIAFHDAGVLAGAPVIDRVRPASPADEAGLTVGDLITAIDGTPVERLPALRHLLGPRYAGETVAFTVQRESESLDIPVELVAELLPYAARYLGILPDRPPLDAEPEGIAIRAVLSDSPGADAGLQPGDVIRAIDDGNVRTSAELRDRLSRVTPGATVRLQSSRAGETQTRDIVLTEIPNALPDEVRPVTIPSPPEAGIDEEAPQTGRFTATLPGGDQKFWAYVPESYHSGYAYGLLVWLHPSGDTMEAAMLTAWRQQCDERGIILVAPQAADINGWTAGEAEFVVGVVEHIRESYSIDPARIAVHGFREGGMFAWHLAFKHRDLFRGIVAASAPLRRPPPDNDPDFPQQILTVCPEGDRLLPKVEQSVEILRKQKFPAASLTTPEADADPDLAVDQIAIWLDALDRI